ncbi:glutamate--cysteine ligase [Cysteiniphilum halobium]|uniref:glutamate--cysteine ligase n=1 Tax=Cysteiniphilum halobium TaxID=2219059 RepID=UPI001F434E95|nr:glutamate--cysteine ligase [Cysteiniphilum halobium]
MMNLLTNLNQYQHKRGIERETLRILRSGKAAISDHPVALGSKLTNSNITVDFSEGLLELITEPYNSIDKTLTRLEHILAFSTQNLPENELVLATSMPLTTTEEEIRIADFGTSNSGKMKEVYRRGLAKRYGRIMQAISGVHYNFSYDTQLMNALMQTRKMTSNALYFSAINHYFEFMWLIPYLFGASPICAKTSVRQKPDYLTSFDDEFYIAEYATSLRMSNLGYQSTAQENLFISYDNLQSYVYDLVNATNTPYPAFNSLGLFSHNGLRQQLNGSILQIENEYYSSIRPKQIAKRGERPACALLNRGVAYLEVRVLDVNPLSPLGIDKETAYFIEALLMTCLILPTKRYSQNDIARNKLNFSHVVTQGRNPKLQLINSQNKPQLLQNLGIELLKNIAHTAKNMGEEYEQAVNKQLKKLTDPTQTLSGQFINMIKDDYLDKVLNLSASNTEYLQKFILDDKEQREFTHEAEASLAAQSKLEQSDCCDLNTYIDHYYLSADCSQVAK